MVTKKDIGHLMVRSMYKTHLTIKKAVCELESPGNAHMQYHVLSRACVYIPGMYTI